MYEIKTFCSQQGFSHPDLEGFDSIWMQAKLPKLRKFTFAINDSDRLKLIEDVISTFETCVLKNVKTYKAGNLVRMFINVKHL